MNRRALLQAMFAAPVVAQVDSVHRVYSFLWAEPLVEIVQPLDVELIDAMLKEWYPAGIISRIMPKQNAFLDLLVKP